MDDEYKAAGYLDAAIIIGLTIEGVVLLLLGILGHFSFLLSVLFVTSGIIFVLLALITTVMTVTLKAKTKKDKTNPKHNQNN